MPKSLNQMSLTELESELQSLVQEGSWMIQHELPQLLTWKQREEMLREHNDQVCKVKEAIADLTDWPEEVGCER